MRVDEMETVSILNVRLVRDMNLTKLELEDDSTVCVLPRHGFGQSAYPPVRSCTASLS